MMYPYIVRTTATLDHPVPIRTVADIHSNLAVNEFVRDGDVLTVYRATGVPTEPCGAQIATYVREDDHWTRHDG